MPPSPKPSGLIDSLRPFLHPRVITMLFFGFSAGVPLLLIFSSLSVWLREAGVERSAVTFFSWAALFYSFKFIWAPLVDKLPLPWLTRLLGRRRSWLLLAQCSVMGAILLMGSIDPSGGAEALTAMALAAALLGFSAATQDILIDAYRIESAETRLQALMSSTYIAGYRLGMVATGAGALFLAAAFGTTKLAYVYDAWHLTYTAMSATMLVGVITTLVVAEPDSNARKSHAYSSLEYARLVLVFAIAVFALILAYTFIGGLAANETKGIQGAARALVELIGGDTQGRADGMAASNGLTRFAFEGVRLATALNLAFLVGWLLVRLHLVEQTMARETWVEPVMDFFRRYGLVTSLLLLALVGLYRISDIVLGVISQVFYQDLGFTKTQIGTAVNTFGLLVSIAGAMLGGVLTKQFGVLRILMLGAILSAGTNLVFIGLAYAGNQIELMYMAVAADNLAAGLASAAFIAFLSSLTNVSFTATQYAIFSSLMTLIPKLLGGYSGSIVDDIGYPGFFIFTTLIGVPVLVLVWLAGKRLKLA